MNVSTWGEIDSTWIGRHVRVRWEDAGMPLAEGLPSGTPHEFRGQIIYSYIRGFYGIRGDEFEIFAVPAHALVQEEEPQ